MFGARSEVLEHFLTADIAAPFSPIDTAITKTIASASSLHPRLSAQSDLKPQLPACISSSSPSKPVIDSSTKHIAAICLGSNLGDRFANIELALRFLETPRDFSDLLDHDAYASVINTSFMYETAPMYVTDQPAFINCACLVSSFVNTHAPMINFIFHID